VQKKKEPSDSFFHLCDESDRQISKKKEEKKREQRRKTRKRKRKKATGQNEVREESKSDERVWEEERR